MSHRRLALLVAFAAWTPCFAAGAAERVRVALLPLVVHSGEGREYLQQGMTDMLVSRLGRDRSLAVIPIDEAAAATTDVAAARKVGQSNDAAYVVFGSLTRFGEGASVDLSVASAADDGSEPRTLYVHAGTMGALIPLLDGAAERIAGVVHGGRDGIAPEPDDVGGAGALQELRRRVEVLERAVLRSRAPAVPGGGGSADPERRQPGLPSDRDADGVR